MQFHETLKTGFSKVLGIDCIRIVGELNDSEKSLELVLAHLVDNLLYKVKLNSKFNIFYNDKL